MSLCVHTSSTFLRPPTFSHRRLSCNPKSTRSMSVESPPAPPPAEAPPPVEKSAPDATEKPGKSSASTLSRPNPEFWDARVGPGCARGHPMWHVVKSQVRDRLRLGRRAFNDWLGAVPRRCSVCLREQAAGVHRSTAMSSTEAERDHRRVCGFNRGRALPRAAHRDGLASRRCAAVRGRLSGAVELSLDRKSCHRSRDVDRRNPAEQEPMQNNGRPPSIRPSDHQTVRPSTGHQCVRPSVRQAIRSDHQTVRPSDHQTSDHQTVRPSSHQTIRPSGHPQAISASGHQCVRPSDQTIRPSDRQTIRPLQTIRPSDH